MYGVSKARFHGRTPYKHVHECTHRFKAYVVLFSHSTFRISILLNVNVLCGYEENRAQDGKDPGLVIYIQIVHLQALKRWPKKFLFDFFIILAGIFRTLKHLQVHVLEIFIFLITEQLSQTNSYR